MTESELSQLIEAIMKRGDPAYKTPSGAFLEQLSKFASELKLSVFAEACLLYTSNHPEVSAFIAARVPGILCNNYFTVLPDFNYEKFIRWSCATDGWANALKEGFDNYEKLSQAVQGVVSAVESYA